MEKIDRKMAAVKRLQEEMEHRKEVEKEAETLICEGEFEKATALLATLDDSVVKELAEAVEADGEVTVDRNEQEKEVKKVVATETKTDFIGISSTIKKKGREGCIQVFTQVQGMPVTDRELAELRRLQEKAAAQVDEMLKD